MSVFDLFSKRQKRQRGEVADVYVYDKLPRELRVQFVHVLRDLLGQVRRERYHGFVPDNHYSAYQFLVDALNREYGTFRLPSNATEDGDPSSELFNFLLQTDSVERALDVVELATRYADRKTRNWEYLQRQDFDEHVSRGIEELNARFREHGVGYHYEAGELIRIDSDLIHAEAVKPALTLLKAGGYSGPLDEFLRAHEHYRHGRHDEALNEALKSFESTMKAICDKKKWKYESGATAKALVNVCFQHGLIDEFWQTHLSALRNTLENGIATARNKLGGHGQGAVPREVPRSIVSYVLHMTASTIVFLIESAANGAA
jgi:hypothetical protein